MNTPKVSVIIPTYNQSSFVQKAVESALAQDYDNVEVIVSDDNSSDNTAHLLRVYEKYSNFRYYRNEENLGRVKNYQHALKNLATGDWVVILDGDDYYSDCSFIKTVMNIIKDSRDEVAFAQGGQFIQFDSHTILDNPNIDSDILAIDGRDYFLKFHRWKHFSHLSTVFNRAKALSIDFYRFNISSSDVESFLRLALHGKVILIKKPFGSWVQHGRNHSSNLSVRDYFQNFMSILGPYRYAKANGLKQGIRNWLLFQTILFVIVFVKRHFLKRAILFFFPKMYFRKGTFIIKE
jgi:glycosyltransferase involved in cell wall biosynthesis